MQVFLKGFPSFTQKQLESMENFLNKKPLRQK